MINYQSCPSCGSAHIASTLNVKDHTVSQQTFAVWECRDCTLRFTQGVPGPDEIGAYYQSENYISHTDTKEGIVNRLYHAVRKRTLQQKLQLIKRTTGLQQGTILDIGAGTGAFLHTMQQAGWKTQGIEPDANARQRAAELYGLSLDSPDQLPALPAAHFDAVTMWHVLEHVHDLHGYIDNCKRILKPGAKLIIAVPNYTSYDAAVYKENWAAYDVPRHLYHFSPCAMRLLLEKHGLQLKTVKPMWYDSFYVSMLSEQYRAGHADHISAVFNGFMSNIKAIFNRQQCSSLIYIIGKED